MIRPISHADLSKYSPAVRGFAARALGSLGILPGSHRLHGIFSGMISSTVESAYVYRELIKANDLGVSVKLDKTLKTNIDDVLNRFISDRMEGCGMSIIGEESDHDPAKDQAVVRGGNYLALDPIDGTKNCIRVVNGDLEGDALDHVTLFGMVLSGRPVFGVCANQFTGEFDAAVNDGQARGEVHFTLKDMPGLSFAGQLTGRERVDEKPGYDVMVVGASYKDDVNRTYADIHRYYQIKAGGLGFRIITLANPMITKGFVYHVSQAANIWDLAAPQVFADLNGVNILDGVGNPLDYTRDVVFPGGGAMAFKGPDIQEEILSMINPRK